MRYLLMSLFCALSAFTSDPTLDRPSRNNAEPAVTNVILQSKDGGQTWEDISHDLPENGEPQDFFAGESDVYMRLKNVMYHSKSNSATPVWEKANVPDPGKASIVFNRSGVVAYSYDGDVYKKISVAGGWVPMKNFKKPSMRGIFETSNGTLFLGSDKGLFKSTDNGQSWKLVLQAGWVTNLIEADGVLLSAGVKGIMRSTDNGVLWELVISEGGVGIAVERIEGGFAAITFNTQTQTRRIRSSMDGGKTWKAIDESIQPSLFVSSINGLRAEASISSIKQMGKNFVCGHPQGIMLSTDRGQTWNVVRPGVDQKVYKLYSSGNVLYAVLGSVGC